MNRKKALITDIDNTLFDWFTMWYKSFSIMIDTASNISGVPREDLHACAKKIHQKYGTAEYAFLLEELEPLLARYGDKTAVINNMSPAIQAYRSERKKHMVLYPGVMETLEKIRQKDMVVLAFSESKKYYSSFRIQQLGLDGIVKVIYCPEDHILPDKKEVTSLLKTTECHMLDGEFKKPNPEILLRILSDSDLQIDEVLYVGDSKSKDIRMALDAGIDFLWCEYGASHLNAKAEDYELLKRVTHWSQSEVDAERLLAEDSRKLYIHPSRVIQNYTDVLNYI